MSTQLAPMADVVVAPFKDENETEEWVRFTLLSNAATKFLMTKQPPIYDWRWLSGSDEQISFAVRTKHAPALIRRMKKAGLLLEGA